MRNGLSRRRVGAMGAAVLGAGASSLNRVARAQEAEPVTPTMGGTVTVQALGPPATLQPLLSSDTASSQFIALHYNAPLIRRDPDTLDLDVTYGTAESLALADDGLSVTVVLKPGLQWSDGQPLTAFDYAFTWDRMMDRRVDFPFRSSYARLAAVTAEDERTLTVRLADVSCSALNLLSFEPIPRHVFERLDINQNPFNEAPVVGSGPWLLQELRPDSHATFAANDRFYLGRPYLDQYVIVISPANSFRLLEQGAIDQATVAAADWPSTLALPGVNAYAYYPAAASWTYIGMNLLRQPLDDVRVRRALAHAIDRDSLMRAVRGDHARQTNSIYPPSSWAHTPDVPAYPYSPETARRLLDEAGWLLPTAPSPGRTRMKDGRPLRMRLVTNSGNGERERIALVAQQQAAAVGIELQVTQEDFNAVLNRVYQTLDYELVVLGWASGLEPASSASIWATGGNQNTVRYSNARVDELFAAADRVPGCGQQERRALYAEIQRLISGDAPYVFLWENEVLGAINSRLVPNPLTRLGIAYRPWEWYSTTGT